MRTAKPGAAAAGPPAVERRAGGGWALLLVSALLSTCVGLGGDAGAQTSPAGPATTSPASTTAANPVDRAALEGRIAALEQQLDDLEGAIPQKRAARDQALQAVADFERLLADNQAAVDLNVAAHVGPEAARQELVLTLYIQGPVQQRSFSEFVETGELGSATMRRDRLFEAAEEGTRARLVQLDAEAAQLAAARAGLLAQRDGAVAAVDAARADLDATIAQRDLTYTELGQARADLKTLLALSQRSPLTGSLDYPLRPAIGVKIDNSFEARPQTGLTKADVVYDIIVEGGITRFLAIFQSQDAPRIGPVRSARTSDISIMAGYNRPLFAYSGGNDGVLAAVRVSPMISLTEASAGRAFVRDEGRLAPHNLFTSTSGLYAAGSPDAGVPNPQFMFRQPGEPSAQGRPVSVVEINIGFETVRYEWNGTGWNRFTNGEPTADTTAGQVAPANVIVQFTNYTTSPADAQSPDALTVGQGMAWVLTDGKVIDARWARSVATTPVQYLDAANAQIPLTPGQTWVELPRPGGAALG